jgi:hypothetical protein
MVFAHHLPLFFSPGTAAPESGHNITDDSAPPNLNCTERGSEQWVTCQ